MLFRFYSCIDKSPFYLAKREEKRQIKMNKYEVMMFLWYWFLSLYAIKDRIVPTCQEWVWCVGGKKANEIFNFISIRSFKMCVALILKGHFMSSKISRSWYHTPGENRKIMWRKFRRRIWLTLNLFSAKNMHKSLSSFTAFRGCSGKFLTCLVSRRRTHSKFFHLHFKFKVVKNNEM